MRDRIAHDRLIVKLFYTACCVWTGFLALLHALVIGDPNGDRWDPNAVNVAYVYAIALFVVLPIWVPAVRRQYSGLPHDVLEVPRIIWAFLAPFAATLVLWLSLGLPITFLFSSTDNTRALAILVALLGSAAIVLFTWDVAADRNLVPPRQARPGQPEESGKPP